MSKLYVTDGEYFQPATQTEVDAAASEQMRQDAKIGRMLLDVLLWDSDTSVPVRIGYADVAIWLRRTSDRLLGRGYLNDSLKIGEMAQLFEDLSLAEAGLIEEEQ